MKIAIVTDAWEPQTSGVVTSLKRMTTGLSRRGHQVLVIHPGQFRNWPCPTYPDIRLALWPFPGVARMLDGFDPHCLHLPAEGPLGWAGRRWAMRRGRPFTTAYMTRFPEYVQMRTGLPPSWTFAALRRFHGPAAATMVSTPQLEQELARGGMGPLVRWGRGVDTDLFRPTDKRAPDIPETMPRPLHMYMGRVAVEKNLESFLDLPLAGSRVVIGDGPALQRLRRDYPSVLFLGRRTGDDLAVHLAAADVFVFPSLTDTFGIVLIEAMACGVPVAAHPVTGPVDVVRDGVTGALDHDLGRAISRALRMDPRACREYALTCSWERSLDQFESNLVSRS